LALKTAFVISIVIVTNRPRAKIIPRSEAAGRVIPNDSRTAEIWIKPAVNAKVTIMVQTSDLWGGAWKMLYFNER
jgi:hypothetical protein